MLPLALGVLGVLELLFPRRLVEFYTRLAYEEPDAFEVRPWVTTAARLEGATMVLLAARWMNKRRRARQSRPEADAAATEIVIE